MWHVVSDGGWTPIRCAALRIVSLPAWFGMWTPEASRAIASRNALRPRVLGGYHSRGRPGGSGRFSTGAYGRSSTTPLLAVDWVGSGLRAAAGTGILLSRSECHRNPRRHPRTLPLFYCSALTKGPGHKAFRRSL